MNKKNSASVGNLKVSKDVIAKIAELAACEIAGVAVENGHLFVSGSPIGIPNLVMPPVRASVSKEAAVIDLSIVTEQGSKAVNVASNVQNNVKSAVQNMTGIPVSKVNVNIVGIKLNPMCFILISN